MRFPMATPSTHLTRPNYSLEPDRPGSDQSRLTVSEIQFLGEVQFPTGLTVNETELGGISGLTYDPTRNVYYALSDDRSQINSASVVMDLIP